MKIVLVTGGSRGLGKNTALQLARRGFDVVLTYHRNADEANQVRSEIEQLGRKAAVLQLDTTRAASFEAFAAALKSTLSETWNRAHFDVLVNNADSASMPHSTARAKSSSIN